jgi:hypothetical protein
MEGFVGWFSTDGWDGCQIFIVILWRECFCHGEGGVRLLMMKMSSVSASAGVCSCDKHDKRVFAMCYKVCLLSSNDRQGNRSAR